MRASTNIAFKEWAVVVAALGRGTQVLILRKGGLHEHRGQFHVEHREFWLFPTRYHEAETAVIPAHRPALRELAGRETADTIEIQYFAAVTDVHHLTSLDQVRRLQDQHIWSESVVQQRFEFGREPGLYALVVRVFRLPTAVHLPRRDHYGGCQSWVELEHAPASAGLVPVLDELAFQQQQAQIAERLPPHALAHL